MDVMMINRTQSGMTTNVQVKLRQSGNIKYNGEYISYQIDDHKLTTVKLSDGSRGIAKLDKEDKYDEATGIFIAYWKAKKVQANKIKDMEPEIDKHLEDIKKL